MAQRATITLRVVFENERCLKALRKLIECAESIAEDFEYRDDAKQLVKCAKYLAKHTKISSTPK
jgi:hypothetical protein